MTQRLAWLAVALAACSAPAAADKPNVVLIVTDDAGWADYGFMRAADPAANPGNRGAIPTPNLDAIAGDGVTFTNAYTGSVCSPSRAMITTGQYGTRFGYATNIASSSVPINQAATVQGLPTEITTIWEYMQAADYDTAAVGKWHIGLHPNGGGQLGNLPENQGVEFFQGLWSGSRGYTAGSATGSQALRETISDGAGNITSNAVIEGTVSGQYVTDVFGDQSADYIRNNAASADPFFLYTSFTAPHTPLEATAADLAFIDSLNEPGFTGNRRTQAAMQYSMDRNVGKILDALDDPDNDGDLSDSIRDNTLILFINDNGGDCCDSGPNASDNGDLRNGKGSQFEGGMRVPMIVSGAGVNQAARGTVSTDLVHSIDLVPTAFVGAGEGTFAPTDVVDGVNLLPYINGETPGVAHEDLFISRFSNQQSAVRKGDWKYMYQNGTGYQLYNLATDLNESNNQVNNPANAAVVEEMHQLLASYHVEMDKPRHDNNADNTNQFDHFQFREGAFAAAAFSTANAWANGDTGAGSFTATWRDGYADNELTFRTKPTGDYTVTNDLTSVGGFAYMANKINLTSQAAPLSVARTGTIGGLAVLLTKSRDGAGPEINLDATDALADTFTFNIDHDVEVYDDLTIQGDGNQRFIINGQIREFRPGRNVTKQGASNLTFGGGVDVSGTLDVQGGDVAFTNGQVTGSLMARAGSSIVVGGVGFNELLTTPPTNNVPIVTAGLELNYDASLDIAGDATWSDATGGPGLAFLSGASPVPINDPTFQSINAAYNIPTTGGAGGLGSFFEGNAGSQQRSRQDGSFEVWFNASDLSAGGDQVLFEVGGADRGISFLLNDDTVSFNVNGDGTGSQTFSLSSTIGTGWHQLVGVIDIVGLNDDAANDSITLYLDNQVVGTLSGLLIDDWAGGNNSGIGETASSLGAGGVPAGYHNDIAIVRYYEDTILSAADVEQNYLAAMVDDGGGTTPIATLLALGGDYTQEAGAALELDLLDTSSHDTVTAVGDAAIDGELVVGAIDGFAPALGDVFTILEAASVTGSFSAATLPELAEGLDWTVVYGAQSVSLVVSLEGDFNGDGVVSAADYVSWRDRASESVAPSTVGDLNGSGQIDAGDVAGWRRAFGAQAPLSAAAAVVPEPVALPLTLVGVAFLASARPTP